MIQPLYRISWVMFLLSVFVIILGGIYALVSHAHTDKRLGVLDKRLGVLIVYIGFMGLALSGFLMTIAYDILS